MLASGEDMDMLPTALPFSPRQPAGQVDAGQAPVFTSPIQPIAEQTPNNSISAPYRRARQLKPLEFDDRPGLTNEELRQWNEGYLNNMQQVTDAKQSHKLASQAKKNAEHWVLGRGIGGVGSGLGQSYVAGPLQEFSGTSLLAALTGKEPSPAGTKHARSTSFMSAAEDGERRVRLRHGGSEQGGVGAGEQDLIQTGQDEGIFAGNDEMACSYNFPLIAQC
jgi:meiotic recombination protein REC8, fungi type